ncbi:hypothetical protein ACTXT7_009833 [Hymenolepis weldensis]
MFRCEVCITASDSKSAWKIRTIEGVLVGQYRLNLPSISEHLRDSSSLSNDFNRLSLEEKLKMGDVYTFGLDPQSHVSWIRPLKSTTQFPFQLGVERQSAKIILKARLPENLPPSYRGHIIRFAYKVLVKVDVDDKPIQLLRLPFRVLPTVASYYPLDSFSTPSASGLMSNTYGESQSVCDRISDPFHVDFNSQVAYGNNPFENGSLQKTAMHPAVYEKLYQLYTDDQVSSTINFGNKSKKNKNKRARTASLSQSPSAMFAEIVLSGPLDFRTASLPSFECIIRAQTYEYFDPSPQTDIYPDKDLSFFSVPIDVPSVSKSKVLKLPENAMKTTWFETKLECANTKFLPFSIPLPLNAPAEFMLASRYWNGVCRVHWCIRFDFIVAKAKARKKSLSTPDMGLYNLFLRDTPISKNPEYTSSIDCETQALPWELPVCVIPNGPTVFLVPSHSMSTCNFTES